VPSLQDRIEDAVPIAETVLHRLNERNSTSLYFSETVKLFLTSDSSPVWHYKDGGVGELKADVKNAFNKALNADTTQITPFHFELRQNPATNEINRDGQPSLIDADILEKFDFLESLMKQHNSKMKLVGKFFSEKYGDRGKPDSSRQGAGQWLITIEARQSFDLTKDAKRRWSHIYRWYCQPRVKIKPESCQ
jgi:hypothetical protein